MRHNSTTLLLSFAVSAFLFSSCKPKPDTDAPLPAEISPSVFIGSQNQFIYALNPTTGVKKWECFIGSDIKSSPVLHNNILFIGNASSTLFKLNPNNGSRSASSFLFTGGITTTPAVSDSMIYVPYGNKITGLQIEKDKAIWTFTAGGPINSSPTISDTGLIFGCDDGSVYKLDRRKGTVIWKTKNYATLFPSSPAVDTTLIFIGAENGRLYALKIKDGTEAWPLPKQTDGPIKSSPMVYGGMVFFGSDDNKLYAAQIIDGATVWTMTASDRVRSSPFLQGQTIYVGSYDKMFYAVNVLDGSIKWTVTTGGLILSSPVYYNGRVYFGSYDKNFYAIDTAKGATTWKYAINGLIDCSPTVDVNNGAGINSTISGNSVY